MLCWANTTISLISGLIRYPSSVFEKKRLNLVADTSGDIIREHSLPGYVNSIIIQIGSKNLQ
jgi:hypothetical protein